MHGCICAIAVYIIKFKLLVNNYWMMYNTAMAQNKLGNAAVHASEFKDTEARFYYLDGDDVYWREKAVKAFVEPVPEEWRDFNLKRLPSAWTAEMLYEAVSAFSPIPDVPVRVVAGGIIPAPVKKKSKSSGEPRQEGGKADAQRWASITGESGDVKVLICEGGIPASVKKNFVAIDCSKPGQATLEKLVKQCVMPARIDYRAANLLIQYTDGNAMGIYSEGKKLASYADEGGEIKCEDVEALVGDNMEHAVYELSNALADKDKPKAGALKDRFIAGGMEYTQLFWLLINQYRRLLHSALSPLSDAELAEKMGVREYAVKVNRRTAKKYSKADLKAVLDLLVKAEYDYRSGVCSDETAFCTAFAQILTM